MVKRSVKKLVILLILVGMGLLAFTYYQGKQLASPTRRLLQDYHHEWLKNPEHHGISIKRATLLNGMAPCLIVAPDPKSQLGQRGQSIREQLTTRGIKLTPHGNIIGNLVLLHGRNGRKEDLLPVAERFCAVGLRCIIPDLPAHGESPISTVQFGFTDWEKNLPQQLLLECATLQNFTPTPCALWGISMGGSFATRAASAEGPWKCLVIVSSFDTLENTLLNNSHSQTLTNLTSYFCRQHGGANIPQVTPAKWAKSVTIPTLVAHGTSDSLIHPESGKKLFEHFSSTKKQWIEVPGGDHDNVLITPMPLYATMAEWILENIIL